MYRAQSPPRKYEEYAYVLDFNPRGKSTTVRGRDGIIITSIGEDRLTLLEVLGVPNSNFEIGEKIYIGKEGRTKILSVLGKLEHGHISSSAQSELSSVVENIVTTNEAKFVSVDAKDAKEMKKKLIKDCELTEDEAVEIVNIRPTSMAELRSFTFGWKKLILAETLEKMLKIIQEHS